MRKWDKEEVQDYCRWAGIQLLTRALGSIQRLISLISCSFKMLLDAPT
jgi:hypothetical protein